MPLIPNLSLYLIQKFDRLALWGNLTILELHFAETQESQPLPHDFLTRQGIFLLHYATDDFSFSFSARIAAVSSFLFVLKWKNGLSVITRISTGYS